VSQLLLAHRFLPVAAAQDAAAQALMRHPAAAAAHLAGMKAVQIFLSQQSFLRMTCLRRSKILLFLLQLLLLMEGLMIAPHVQCLI
jgi:hypothetical protein